MKKRSAIILKFYLELLRIGLKVNSALDIDYNETVLRDLEWSEVYHLAQEQAVQGVVLQGIEWFIAHNTRFTIPHVVLFPWIGEVQVIERRNKEMNTFVAKLIVFLRKNDIYALLIKGQEMAQCYDNPLLRSSGDVDLFLSEDNYTKAKSLLLPLASHVEGEHIADKHLGMTIDGWKVELHGHLYSGLSSRIERELDRLQEDTFYSGQVRSWMNGQTQIFLLRVENDAFYVFTHILQHFYKEGVGLRQICDWCRLLYTFKDSLNYELLESRIKRAGLMSEWKAFYNLASRYLGMPDLDSRLSDVESTTSCNCSNKFDYAHDSTANFMACDSRYDKRADRIMDFILRSGNMGHNRDMSHFSKYPYFIRKCVSMGRRIGDLINHSRIFPLDSLGFFTRIMFNGVRSAIKGE